MVGDSDANAIRRLEWSQNVAYVPQEPRLVHGTIRDNIRYFRPDISDAAIERAAEQAQIHGAIAGMPEGYDTVVGRQADAV